ncbi:LysR family transcriptional regulator [Rhodoligotrophos defluvii]|uniref:LysR family transcriptional regulator n=1 Tax=Rhodoligotrophos defluvii TaxID=2561934 RepID=UPI001484C919|nr:LysR family transcriptional regulator [Rhodoligotrophos defluvii]
MLESRNLPDLKAFRVFVAVAEGGGIKAAAEKLGRTPSAISMTLKALEESLGAPLFQAERKAHLTPFGRLVLDEARELLHHFATSCATMQSYARNQIGRCDVASVTSVSIAFLPAAIRRVQQTLPEFGVHVRQMESKFSADALLDGVVDIAFAAHLPRPDEISFEPLFRDAFDIVCAENDPLTKEKTPLSWSAIRDRPFIFNDSFAVIRTPELLEITERAVMWIGSVFALLAALRQGLGVSVLPRLCRVQGAEGLRFLPVEDPTAFRVVGLLSKKDRRQLPGTRHFANAVYEVIQEQAGIYDYELLSAKEPTQYLPA